MTWGIVKRRTREAMLVACSCGLCGEVLKVACEGGTRASDARWGAFLGQFCSPRMSRAGDCPRGYAPRRCARASG